MREEKLSSNRETLLNLVVVQQWLSLSQTTCCVDSPIHLFKYYFPRFIFSVHQFNCSALL